MVDPRLVTACPTSVTPAATNAAMLSVVPPQTRAPGGSPARAAAAGERGATGAPGATTVGGSSGAKSWGAGAGARGR
jgi:hypothetical protein